MSARKPAVDVPSLVAQRHRAELLLELARALAHGDGVTTTMSDDGLEVTVRFRPRPK